MRARFNGISVVTIKRKIMQTTEQWMNKILSSTDELNHWLQRQYVGECLAAKRISELQIDEDVPQQYAYTLTEIAHQEYNHSEWVKQLLIDRDIPIPEVTDEGVRYWKAVLPEAITFEDLAAAGHHAEAMRLVRIRVLASNPQVPDDIRAVFQRILPDEEWHEKAFAQMSNEDSIAHMQQYHEAGLQLLGLEV